MEDSMSNQAVEYETKRLMYKYQYVFLLMQKSFTALGKLFQNSKVRKIQKCFHSWRNQTSESTFQHMYNEKVNILDLQEKFRRLNYIAKNQVIMTTHQLFSEWHSETQIIRYIQHKQRESQRAVKQQEREIAELEQEAKLLERNQQELHQVVSNIENKEVQYKKKIAELKAKYQQKSSGNYRGTVEDEKDQGRLAALQEENKELKQKIHSMEQHVCYFLKSLTEMLDKKIASKTRPQSVNDDDIMIREGSLKIFRDNISPRGKKLVKGKARRIATRGSLNLLDGKKKSSSMKNLGI